jgi:hypothetical protein
MFGVYLRRERLAQVDYGVLPQTVKYSVVHLGKSFPSKIYPKHETKLRSRSPYCMYKGFRGSSVATEIGAWFHVWGIS